MLSLVKDNKGDTVQQKLDESFLYMVYAIVEEIPKGKVASYGQIADLAGRPQNSRLIGRALAMSGIYGSFPCHRVVNHQGRLVPGWNEQYDLLAEEGVVFTDKGFVDMKECQWKQGLD